MSLDDKTTETAQEALDNLIAGVMQFREDIYPEQRELFSKLAHEQTPRAMFITCADSRILPELITQSSPGDLFVTRNVGNIVPPYGIMNGGVSTAIEFAVMALGVHHIIVCGHSDCGAMKAVLNPSSLDGMPTVRSWLRHAEVARTVVEENCGCADHNTLGVLTEENVLAQLDHLRTHPSVAARLASGQLFIHGWVYNIGTSEIRAYDAAKGEFRLIGDGPLPMATPKSRYV
ncbi:carbonic anhydrase [Stutzerimonas zhaodongensis]|uniref:carbonic anhydrase n=1 Tax=Stutzerimonas TaxID=2901164 RepID=UPI003890DADA